MLNSVTFSPLYSPSRVERFSAALDSYFYLGGKQTKVIDKSSELGIRLVTQHETRAISTVEKILKIFSWIFIPITITAWLLRLALHLYLHIAYPCIYLDAALPEALQKDIFITCQKISHTLNTKTILTTEADAYQELSNEGITLLKPQEECLNVLPERFYLDSRESYTFYFLGRRDKIDTHSLDLYNLIQLGRNFIAGYGLTNKNVKKSIAICLKDRFGITAKITSLPKQNQALYQGLKAEFRFDNYPNYVCTLKDNTISMRRVVNSYAEELEVSAIATFVKNVLEARYLEKRDSSHISWPKYVGCDMGARVVILDDEEEHKEIITSTPEGDTTTNLRYFSSKSFVECYHNMKKRNLVPYILGKNAVFKHHQNRYQLIMNEVGSSLPVEDVDKSTKHVMSAFLRQVPSAFLKDVLREATAQEVTVALPSLDIKKIARSLDLDQVIIPKSHILIHKPLLRGLSSKEIKLELAIEFIQQFLSPAHSSREEVFIPYRQEYSPNSPSSMTIWGCLSNTINNNLINSILMQLVEMHVIERFTEVYRGVFVRVSRL
ncbi:DUF648 domain-containing protein [Chlamydia psittaci]|uniref:DUF648 domain-containing protein n=1 Tax=Chlamydia psittaci TaxID=83554 RepID=UPI00027E1246|nr:DUF648 domain-containing protein [Chlamydia psittaci]AFS21879.1 hypothetical protein B599_0601 [Chlamydia psittaci MN]AFS27040.1 hypothetical protein B711_0642 [Chlamydia psittaci CP3]KPZ35951.1 membrane protein [Chlamydia psittaci CP3]KPZ39612.1 membrane protein [Chlamydia psittaci str. Frances]MBE3635725.1 DUF648 domain-containing protein [Chlamydia psittaci]